MERRSSSNMPLGGEQPRVSNRPRRKLKSNPSLRGNGQEEQPERDGHSDKGVTEAVEGDSPPAVDATPLKSKEFVAEGAEHVYRTHTCPTCRRCFKMRSHLQEHLHLHFPDPSLQCPTCKRYFTSKSKLRVHRLREAGEKLHRCHLCEYSAVERNAIRRHLASVHTDEAQDGVKSQSYPCPTCGQGFRQSRSLKAHMKTHNVQPASKPVACVHQACSFQSSSRKELLRHTVEVHGVKAAECRHHACGAIFPTEAEMEIHYRTHVAYHCSQCDFSSSNKTLFLQHQRLGHAGADELCCDFCSFVTFNPVELEQHVGHLHANEKIHRCSQCGYVTSHKRGLKRHMLMHSGDKPHKCSLCDFRCRDESYLSRHMLTHSDDKNFMCAECGYVTKWKHYLNVHMRKHAGDLRYQCDQCPYRCHRMDQLNSHKLRHQDKSLICEICAYACKRKYELRNHMLAKHSGEERQPSAFSCKYCAYTTCHRQALQNHENCKHTRLREFRCALCPYSSFSSISLFLHKRKAHGYVPGDRAWLENYAAKERDRNSTGFAEDFYNERSAASQREPCGLPAAAGPSASSEPVSGPQAADAVEVSDEVRQEVVDGGVSHSPPTVSSPEEYCTLILTTLSSTDYQTAASQNPEENGSNPTAAREKAVSSPPYSSEDDNVAPPREDGGEPLNSSTGPTEGPEKCPTPGVESGEETAAHSRPSGFEVRLEAMKKHDRDQAEAMVLEGRVQMLVVPTGDAFRCDRCPYVTFEEAALKRHSQTLCRGKVKEHACEACGARFKQRRGLDSHLAKKCPKLPRKNRCPGAEESCCQGEEGETSDAQVHRQEEEVTTCEGFDDSETTSPELKHRQSKTRKVVKKQVVSHNEGRRISPRRNSLRSKADGAFKSVERHVAPCGSGGSDQIPGQCASDRQTVSDPSCAREPDQRTALLDGHKKREGAEPGGCTSGSSDGSSTRRVPRVHQRKRFDVAKAKHLRCLLCAFTCKPRRCMAQHVALKHKGARPHRCKYCPFATTRRYRLEEHQSLHTGLGRHTCEVCDKTFGASTKLRQHKMRIHDKRPTHFCSACDFSGYALDDVRRHKLRCHTGELKHACGDCGAGFSSESALRNHCKRAHRLQGRFPCTQCDYTCSGAVALKSHQRSKHRPVTCTTCQESFPTGESLELHQRSHLAHRCQLCPFATRTRQLLAQHLGSEHEEGPAEDKPLRCGTCEFACRHQLVLEQHLRSHGGRRLYKCTDCEYSTRNKQKVTWHIRIHTGEKPYSCEQCSYTCTDPSRLKLHMRVHQEERKYLCPECGYKCKWASQLKYHMTKHTGEKPYTCDECDYRTNRADALRAHRDTQHCDVRPYVCEKCGKAFKTSFILKTHQRQHSDDRAYACGLCHKAFRWPAGLRHHYLSHTKQRPFRCRHCSYSAKQKFQVVKHLRRHHPGTSVEQGVARDSDAVSLTLKEALQGTLDDRVAGAEEGGKGGT